MRVLIVNTTDLSGGAAKAAFRLHKALLNNKVDSQMLVKSKTSDDFTVIGDTTNIRKVLNQTHSMLDTLPVHFYKKRSKTFFSPSWVPSSSIVNKINELAPDVVHLHWVCRGMIRIEDLAKINAPIVWSLHDMWSFTGGCHYNETCNGYKSDCGNCLVLGSNKKNDLSHRIFNRKCKTFKRLSNLTIIGLSQWLAQCAKESTLLKSHKIINLPNPIDTDLYKAFDNSKAKRLWNLPQEKKLVLFGAIDATADPRKGFKELSQALEKIKSSGVELVVFGSNEPREGQCFGLKTHYMGFLYDDISLVTLYSAVDVVIVPSLQENLSNTIMESLSCETPVVGFDIGGNSDLIEHKENGYLASPLNTQDLADGIDWVLRKKDSLQKAAREKVLSTFDSKIVSKHYIDLYSDLTNNNS